MVFQMLFHLSTERTDPFSGVRYFSEWLLNYGSQAWLYPHNHLPVQLKKKWQEPHLLRFWLTRFQTRIGIPVVKGPHVWLGWLGSSAVGPLLMARSVGHRRSWIRAACLTRPTGDLCAHYALRSPPPIQVRSMTSAWFFWKWNIDSLHLCIQFTNVFPPKGWGVICLDQFKKNNNNRWIISFTNCDCYLVPLPSLVQYTHTHTHSVSVIYTLICKLGSVAK